MACSEASPSRVCTAVGTPPASSGVSPASGCPTGEAKITKGYRLPAHYVIHTVGPVWHGGDKGEANLLASCYQRSLELAADHNLHTLAFPSISTGIYGYPIQQAAEIAVATVREFLAQPTSLTEVTFCCFSQRDLQIYQQLLRSIHDR